MLGTMFTLSQSYRWLKEKVLSDEGRKQQSKLRELTSLASTFDCTLAQLAIGQSSFADRPSPRIFSLAWCLRNDNVHCVLLGASSAEQLYENLKSLQIVSKLTPSVMADIDRILGNKPSLRVPNKTETFHHHHHPPTRNQR